MNKHVWEHPYYGVCYYPEHWPSSMHEEDIRRIAGAGFDMVRMGESAWGYFEPQEGKYQFDMYDRVIDCCAKHKIKVMMGTPTYAGPAWVSQKYPSVLRWDFNRIPMKHGSRRNFNYTSPEYLQLSDRICTALGEHYKDNPQVVGWQLDNEINGHMAESYSPSDTHAFRVWLKKKYQTLDALNHAWGTAFWSQQYDDWEQLDLPHPTAATYNPSQKLDEYRFVTETAVAFIRRQADIMHKINSSWPVTHNGIFPLIDGEALNRELDFYAYDHYPLFAPNWWGAAFHVQRARAMSFPFVVPEQQSGPGGEAFRLQTTPLKGQLRLWAFQSVIHGAKSVIYFRWRTCAFGAEQHWHGILDQDNRNNRRLAEAEAAGHDFRKLPPAFFEAPPVRSVAVLGDYENQVNEDYIDTYTKEGNQGTRRWLGEWTRRNISTDYVWPESDWSGYKLLVAPHLRIISPRLVERFTKYVQDGGTLVLAARSGQKDLNNHVVSMPLPGLLADLAGATVDDWTQVETGQARHAQPDTGTAIPLKIFVEKLKPTTANPLAYWPKGDALLAGAPAITENKIGQGRVIYVGGYSDTETIQALVDFLQRRLALEPVVKSSDKVEALLRQQGQTHWLCLLNHSAGPESVDGVNGHELLTGQTIQGSLDLDPFGVAIVKW